MTDAISKQVVDKPAEVSDDGVDKKPSDDAADESTQLSLVEFDSLNAEDQDAALEITNPEPESKDLGIIEGLKAKIHKATEPKPEKPEPEPAKDAGTLKDGDLPDKETDKPADKKPDAKPEGAEPLFAGKYKTVEELENAHLEVTAAFDRKSNMEGQFQNVQSQLDALKAPAEAKDPEPELDWAEPESIKAHSEWKDRQFEAKLIAMQNQILQGVSQSIQAIPATNSVNKFMVDHPEVPTTMFGAIADYGDKNGHTSLEAALPGFVESLTGKKVDKQPEPIANADSKAEKIKAAAQVPTNLSDVPTEPPGGQKKTAKDYSTEQFEKLSEEEQERLLEEEV